MTCKYFIYMENGYISLEKYENMTEIDIIESVYNWFNVYEIRDKPILENYVYTQVHTLLWDNINKQYKNIDINYETINCLKI